jgi:hypothetical protein
MSADQIDLGRVLAGLEIVLTEDPRFHVMPQPEVLDAWTLGALEVPAENHEQFLDRVDALAEILAHLPMPSVGLTALSSLAAPNESTHLIRLGQELSRHLPEASQATISSAMETLVTVESLRSENQGAGSEALQTRAFDSLGIATAATDYPAAWAAVRHRVWAALEDIRTEILVTSAEEEFG